MLQSMHNQSQKKGKNSLEKFDTIQLIAHRGYCSLFPENTNESIEAALFRADLVQFDIMLTKDHQVIVFHDRFLSSLTNVSEVEEFASKKCSKNLDSKQQYKDDWWVIDFTLAELKTLKLKQPNKKRPQLKNLCFQIPTLEEVLKTGLEVKAENNTNKAGFLIEIKSYLGDLDHGVDEILVERLSAVLKKFSIRSNQWCLENHFPIKLQSFSFEILRALSKHGIALDLIHLYDEETLITNGLLQQHCLPNTIGIAISEKHCNIEIKKLCQDRSLLMYFWTVVDDHVKIPFNCENFEEVYKRLFDVGVNGIICQFPQKCRESLLKFSLERQMKE